jgi:hypothetical protein
MKNVAIQQCTRAKGIDIFFLFPLVNISKSDMKDKKQALQFSTFVQPEALK